MIYLLIALFSILFFLYQRDRRRYSKFEHTLTKVRFTEPIECEKPIDLTAESGAIPSWLHGILYRIGPGRFNIRKNDGTEYIVRHAFDGLPFVHRFKLNGQTQTLTYNSRMTAKSMETAIQNDTLKGHINFGQLNMHESFWAWLVELAYRIFYVARKSERLPDDYPNIVTVTPNYPIPKNLEKNRALVTKTDLNTLQKINADTLEPESTFSYVSYDKNLKGPFSSSHNQWDPKTKETINFVWDTFPFSRLVVFSINVKGESTTLADMTHRSDGSQLTVPYVHSFWMTENYVVIPEFPFYHKSFTDMLTMGNVLSSLFWDKSKPSYLHVIHRDGRGLLASIQAPPFFVFHAANAFEEDGKLFLDCSEFMDAEVVHMMRTLGQPYVETPAKEPFEINGIKHPVKTQEKYGDIVRYCVDLDKQTFSRRFVTSNVEFPRFNHDKTNMLYKFIYGCRMYPKRNDSGSLIKVDMNSGETKEFLVEGHSCSEPIFVPKPDSTEEDDGVLVSLMNSPECCYLVVVDAVEMKELARYKIGQFTALTFHGSFVDHEFKTISPN